MVTKREFPNTAKLCF